jgi:Zn-dependent protease with chaperone function
MRKAIFAGVFVYAALFFCTTFVSWKDAERQAERAGFEPVDIQRGLQYAYEGRLISWTYTGLDFLLLLALACTPLGRRLADRVHVFTGGRWFLTVAGVAACCLVLQYLLAFPFGWVRLEHRRHWELTTRPSAEWLQDWLIGVGILLLMWTAIVVGLLVLIRLFPRRWPLVGTAVALVGGAVYAYAQPLLIAPLFNTFTPLRETKWAALENRVYALTEKAGVEISDVLVIDASRQGRHTNAYFAGFGSSRRIVLFDNLLKKHSFDEVESVLAHEIGHWRNDHIMKGIALAVPGCLLALFLLSRILQRSVGRAPLQLESPADPAAIPLVLLLYAVFGWIAMPVQNAVSRHFERQADLTALELTENPDSFVRVEKGLVTNNIGNVAPTPWNAWLFNTHPTTVEAIEMANEWRQRHRK